MPVSTAGFDDSSGLDACPFEGGEVDAAPFAGPCGGDVCGVA
jgi:hypothetical protein